MFPRTVSPNRDKQIPLEALRDLLGVCRALFAAWKASGQGPIELQELEGIGRDLAAALNLARKTKPNTVGHRAAWSRAEAATASLGHLIGSLEPLRPTVAAATGRVTGATKSETPKTPGQAEREAKKHYTRMRS
jgi:hypothetical protein